MMPQSDGFGARAAAVCRLKHSQFLLLRSPARKLLRACKKYLLNRADF